MDSWRLVKISLRLEVEVLLRLEEELLGEGVESPALRMEMYLELLVLGDADAVLGETGVLCIFERLHDDDSAELITNGVDGEYALMSFELLFEDASLGLRMKIS